VASKQALNTSIFDQDGPDFLQCDLLCRNLATTDFSRARQIERTPLMSKLIGRFLRDDSGATAIEYGLIAAGISVVIIVAVNTIGTNLNGVFTSVSSQLK
jgi:pilus assembly protein Flp/PilA